jgi:signal transduction histidine kinase
MGIRFKLVSMSIFAMFLVLVISSWKARDLVYQDRAALLNEASARQASSLRRFAQQRLQQFKIEILNLSQLRSLGVIKSQGLGNFDFVSVMQSSDSLQWSPTWLETRGVSHGQRLPKGFETTLLSSILYSKIRDGEVHYIKMSDPSQQPIYAIAFAVEIKTAGQVNAVAESSAALPDAVPTQRLNSMAGQRGIIVGVTTKATLATLADDSAGSPYATYIFDDRGYISAHPNHTYVGSLFTADAATAAVLAGSDSFDFQKTPNMQGEMVYSYHEKIDQTNLHLMIQTPVEVLRESLGSFVLRLFGWGFAVLILAAIGVWFFVGTISKALGDIVQALRMMQQGSVDAKIPNIGSADEVGHLSRILGEIPASMLSGRPELLAATAPAPENTTGSDGAFISQDSYQASRAGGTGITLSERLSAERRLAFDQFIQGLKKMMQEPLASILGQAQVLKAKARNIDSSEVSESLLSIENEARKARKVLYRLAGLDLSETEGTVEDKIDISQTVTDVVDRFQLLHADSQIEFKLELKPLPKVAGSQKLIQETLLQILENSRMAMRGRSKQQIHIIADYLTDSIYLQMADNGIGMSKDVLRRVFDPFFHSFDQNEGMGLGMTFVRSVVDRHKASVGLESVPGESTIVTLKFTVSHEDRDRFRSEKTGELAGRVAQVFSRKVEAVPTEFVPTGSEDFEQTRIQSNNESRKIPDLPSKLVPPNDRLLAKSEIDLEDEIDDIQAVSLVDLDKTVMSRPNISINDEPSSSGVVIRKPKKRGSV